MPAPLEQPEFRAGGRAREPFSLIPPLDHAAPEHTCVCGSRNIEAPAADDHHAEEARVLDVRDDTRCGQ